jgi:regulator of protease activity HflC (stomatin/prohibitin superfamily)
LIEVPNHSHGVEQLTATAVRAALARMSLEEAVMSGDPLESEVLGVLHEATGGWGIRTTRVELRMTPVRTGENNDNTE